MSRLSDAVSPVTRNPLRVLGLSPTATQRDVEREGGRILALIAAGLDTPPVPRTAEDVRAAIAYEAEKNPLLKGMGTTCVAILFHPDATFCVHVGDSRLYIFRNKFNWYIKCIIYNRLNIRYIKIF